MDSPGIWSQAAALFRYPGEDYLEVARECHHAMGVTDPDAAALLAPFLHRIESLSTEARQELFTATFDLNPACAPEVGWHLFGENYERGAFLVKMRRQLARFGFTDSGELPDHLSLVLPVLGRMPSEEAQEFAGACLLPALRKMRASLRGKSNPFEAALDAIALLVERRHGPLTDEDSQGATALPAGDGRDV